ncbi:MAG: nucleoside phosphorylase [Clostridiales bacterium]|nr:nucleoside phosphorylase [Clostridiales bacterium]MDY5703183.1 nucleoside phosphorylase [Eubacteriales bacterium]
MGYRGKLSDGARKFIMFGSAGSLDEEKTTGKFVIPTEAYRDEGMSYHYAPPSDYITIRNHERLAGLFDELSLPHVEGRIWTTDAFCRETVGQIAKRRAEGCIAVEMEVAGVQAVCDFHSFELYDFLVTGDVLSTTEYRVEGLHAANHSLDKLYIALEIAKRI